MNLRIPGPTTVPQEVAQAGAADMINHRGPEFAAMIERTTKAVQQVYQTKNDVMTLTSSGTGAMESAIVNLMAPGERETARAANLAHPVRPPRACGLLRACSPVSFQ